MVAMSKLLILVVVSISLLRLSLSLFLTSDLSTIMSKPAHPTGSVLDSTPLDVFPNREHCLCPHLPFLCPSEHNTHTLACTHFIYISEIYI